MSTHAASLTYVDEHGLTFGTKCQCPAMAVLNSRALLTGGLDLTPSSFDEIKLSILYAQLRAISDIKEGGSGSNQNAPEARDPRHWIDIFSSELVKQYWVNTGQDVTKDFTPTPPGTNAFDLMKAKLDVQCGTRISFGLLFLDALSGFGVTSAHTFLDASLDGGADNRRLVRCRMAVDVRLGHYGRELSTAFLVLKYPKEPGASLTVPFEKGTNYWLAAYGHRLDEGSFVKIKQQLADKLKDKADLVAQPYYP